MNEQAGKVDCKKAKVRPTIENGGLIKLISWLQSSYANASTPYVLFSKNKVLYLGNNAVVVVANLSIVAGQEIP